MRLAIIDLGTNSVRFDVHQFDQWGVRQLYREKLMVRLGEGVFLTKTLDRKAVRRTLQAFQSFRRIADEFGVERTVAFGTSALREACDAQAFLSLVAKRTGIKIKVISGSEEAKLIAQGILSSKATQTQKTSSELGSKRIALLDIGGGSTEISICSKNKVVFGKSFQLGTARLQQLYLGKSPPSLVHVQKLRKHIREVILPHVIKNKWPRVHFVIGSSGTVKTASKIISKIFHSKYITPSTLKKLVKRMEQMSTKQICALPGMEKKRADMMLSGVILLEECMRCLGAKKMVFTDYSLRDGLLEREIQKFRTKKRTPSKFNATKLFQKAQQYHSEKRLTIRSLRLAISFVEGLQSLHKLNESSKRVLLTAFFFRNAGESISTLRREKHSAYIFENSEIQMLSSTEIELVSKLILNLEKKPTASSANFRKLSALFKILDALDDEPGFTPTIKKIRIGKKNVRLFFAGSELGDLKCLKVGRKKDLFELVFKRELTLVF